jgi:hypothetical protein
MLESAESSEACRQEGLDPFVVELRVLVADAIRHQTAGALEQPRPFEKSLRRFHRASASDFLGVQSIG